MTAFRVLMAMMHLKRTVEVGFVIGVSEKMTPIGSATLHQIALRKLANDADRTFILDVVVDELGGHHVLQGLIFHNSEPGFLNRQAGQILSLLQSGQHHRLDNAIDVLLRELGKDGGGGSGLTDQSFQVGNPFFTECFLRSRGIWTRSCTASLAIIAASLL